MMNLMYGAQKQMAKRNNTIDVEVTTEISNDGNWNFREKEKIPICTKNIAIVRLKDFFNQKLVFTHDELLDILGIHMKADEENIKMINNPNINTGVITKPEKTVREKVIEYCQTGLDVWM